MRPCCRRPCLASLWALERFQTISVRKFRIWAASRVPSLLGEQHVERRVQVDQVYRGVRHVAPQHVEIVAVVERIGLLISSSFPVQYLLLAGC